MEPESKEQDVPWTMLLPDKRTVFVLVPSQWCGRDRDGQLTFKPPAVELLDRVRVMAMSTPKKPSPGFIRTLRHALGLTQTELGKKLGVDKITVYRWEKGRVNPNPSAIEAMDKLKKSMARKGITLAA